MSKALETTLCLNTFNRDVAIYPEPNDFLLDLKGRYEVQYATLASLEMPLSQYTVEEDWAAFNFDVGASVVEEACRTLDVRLPSGAVEGAVVLPAPWLQVVSEGGGVWRALVPHGLVQAALAVDGLVVDVLEPGAVLDPSAVTAVADATAVSTGLAGPAAGAYGVLRVNGGGARAFATPEQLVGVLNASLAALGWPLVAAWQPVPARAELRALAEVAALVTDQALLLPALGFVCRSGTVTEFPLLATNFPVGARVPRTVEPGHYDPSSFRTELEALLNPLSVAGVVPASSFAVEVFGLAPVLVPVAATRSFHPRGIALAITATLGGLGVPVTLGFEDDRFVFSTAGDPFVVIWGSSSADLDLAGRLGFDPTPTPLAREALGGPRRYLDVPASVTLPLVTGGVSINLERRFVFCARPRLQRAPLVAVVVTSTGTALTVPVGSMPLEYLVLAGGVFAVAERVAGDVVELRPLGPVPAAGAYAGVVVPVLQAGLSLYFPLPPRACFSRLADIAGLRGGASSAFGAPAALLRAPGAWNFDGPAYVLLELGLQHMSALVSHRCQEDLKTQLLAKIPLYPPFKIERGYPMMKSGTGVSYVTQLRLQLFNPWHTPYRFHGRDWSMTLIFGASQRVAHTECP